MAAGAVPLMMTLMRVSVEAVQLGRWWGVLPLWVTRGLAMDAADDWRRYIQLSSTGLS